MFVAIWLSDNGGSYWDIGIPGAHGVGLLMIALCVVVAMRIFSTLTWATPLSADAGLALGAVTFGFYETVVVRAACGDFGLLGAGVGNGQPVERVDARAKPSGADCIGACT